MLFYFSFLFLLEQQSPPLGTWPAPEATPGVRVRRSAGALSPPCIKDVGPGYTVPARGPSFEILQAPAGC